MTMLEIDRLTIDAPHLSAGDAERLAHLVAGELRDQVPRRDESAVIDSARATVIDAGGGVDDLAVSIVQELLRQLDLVG